MVVALTPSPGRLSSIVIFGGWNDAGRDEQNYDLQTSTDGVNFVTLASTGSVNPGVQGTETFVYLKLRKQLYNWGTR